MIGRSMKFVSGPTSTSPARVSNIGLSSPRQKNATKLAFKRIPLSFAATNDNSGCLGSLVNGPRRGPVRQEGSIHRRVARAAAKSQERAVLARMLVREAGSIHRPFDLAKPGPGESPRTANKRLSELMQLILIPKTPHGGVSNGRCRFPGSVKGASPLGQILTSTVDTVKSELPMLAVRTAAQSCPF